MIVTRQVLTIFIGHKYLYERGVLHRDISPGNILIKWQPGSEPDQPSMSGCLIDLDHAKRGNLPQDEVGAPVDDTMINRVRNMIYDASDVGVEKEVARLSLHFPSTDSQGNPALIRLRAQNHATAAISHALDFDHLAVDHLCTPQHLRWKLVWLNRSLFTLS